jgi:hypothetical protein
MTTAQIFGRWTTPQRRHVSPVRPLTAFMVGTLFIGFFGLISPLQASLEQGGIGGEVLIGNDDDNINNPAIQPAPPPPDQSLTNADVLVGGFGDDILIGLLGSDVILGGFGNDIIVGGTEQGTAPNSDIIFGDAGNDVNLWRAGDGSDAFIGGSGYDALVFGNIDRDANNVPTLTPVEGYPNGAPTADVTGQGGFCTLERVQDVNFGFQWLARFFVRSTGALAVTIRLAQVEQVFCTSQDGGQITYADLTQPEPEFVVVSLEQVQQLNPIVGRIIR